MEVWLIGSNIFKKKKVAIKTFAEYCTSCILSDIHHCKGQQWNTLYCNHIKQKYRITAAICVETEPVH